MTPPDAEKPLSAELCGCPACERGIHCSDADAIALALRAAYAKGRAEGIEAAAHFVERRFWIPHVSIANEIRRALKDAPQGET